MVPDALTSNALSYSSPGASDTSESGSQANCYDGNDGTAFSYYGHHGGDGSLHSYLSLTSTWTNPVTIQYIYAYIGSQQDGGNYFGSSYRSYEIDIYYSGAWNSIGTNYTTPGKAGDGAPWTYWNPTITGPWTGVTGVRITSDIYSQSYEGNSNQYNWINLYTLSAFRELLPTAFKVKKGSGIISRGGHPLVSTDDLRMYQDGAIISLPLVATSSPLASPIRIYTSSGVKALSLAG